MLVKFPTLNITIGPSDAEDVCVFNSLSCNSLFAHSQTVKIVPSTASAGSPPNVLTGTNGADTLVGKLNVTNEIFGLGGNDLLLGGGGVGFQNFIYDGSGNDVIYGGLGTNTIHVGSGNDLIFAGIGNGDHIYGGSGSDTIILGNGNSFVEAGPGSDTILFGTGTNTVVYNVSANQGSKDLIDAAGGNSSLYLGVTQAQFTSITTATLKINNVNMTIPQAFTKYAPTASGINFGQFDSKLGFHLDITVDGFKNLVLNPNPTATNDTATPLKISQIVNDSLTFNVLSNDHDNTFTASGGVTPLAPTALTVSSVGTLSVSGASMTITPIQIINPLASNGGEVAKFDIVPTGAPSGSPHATLTIYADGTTTLATNNAFDSPTLSNFTLSFQYTNDDGFGGHGTATASIAVNPNSPPKAIAESLTTNQNTVLTDNIITHVTSSLKDSDPNGDPLIVSSVSNATLNDLSPLPVNLVSGVLGTHIASYQLNSSDGNLGSLIIDANGALSLSPTAVAKELGVGQSLVISFDYTISDGRGGTSTTNDKVTLTGVNDAPVLGSQIADQLEVIGAPITPITAGSHFSDIDKGDTLSFTAKLVDSGGNLINGGTLPTWISINGSSGILSSQNGNPGAADAGNYFIKVIATDTHAASASDIFKVTVSAPANQPPIAVAENLVTDQNTPLSDNLITHVTAGQQDHDPNNDSLIVTGVTNVILTDKSPLAVTLGSGVLGSHLVSYQLNSVDGNFGNLTIDSTGAINLSPTVVAKELGFNQSLVVAFDYTIDDGHGGTNSAHDTVTLNGVNDNPVIGVPILDQMDVSGAAITPINTPTHFSDIDLGDSLTYTAQLVDSGGIVVGTGILPNWISIDSSSGALSSQNANPGVGDVGTYYIKVTAKDSHLSAVSDMFQVMISAPANQPPVAVAENLATDQNTVLSDNLITHVTAGQQDHDPNNDSLIVTGVTNVTLTDNSPLTVTLGSGVLGSHLVSYQLNSVDGNFGNLTIDSTGAINLSPTVVAKELGFNQSLVVAFDYTIDDGHGGTNTAHDTVTLNGVNDIPVIGVPILDQMDVSGAAITPINTPTHFSDIDLGDSLTYTAQLVDSGGIVVGTGILPNWISIDSSSGALSTQNANPGVGDVGTYYIKVTAKDSHLSAVSDMFQVMISAPANQPPVAVAENLATDQNTVLSDNLITHVTAGQQDHDPNNDSLIVTGVTNVTLTDNSPLTVTLGSGVLGSHLVSYQLNSVDGNFGNLTIDSTGAINLSPTVVAKELGFNQSLVVAFDYTIDDGHGGTNTAHDTVTLNGVNDIPVIGVPILDQMDVSGAAITPINTPTHFSDIDLGDSLTYTAQLVDSGGIVVGTGILPNWISIDSSSGALSSQNANPGVGDVGTYYIKVTATDSHLAAVSDMFQVTIDPEITLVAPAPTPPVGNEFQIYPDTIGGALFNASSLFIVHDSSNPSFTATGLPDGLTIDPVSGLIYGTASDYGSFTPTITAHDTGGNVQTSVTLNVQEALDGFIVQNGNHYYGLSSTFSPVLDITMQGTPLLISQDQNAIFVGLGDVNLSTIGDEAIFSVGNSVYEISHGFGQFLDITTQGNPLLKFQDLSAVLIGFANVETSLAGDEVIIKSGNSYYDLPPTFGTVLDITTQGNPLFKLQDLSAVLIGFADVDQNITGDEAIFKEGTSYYSMPSHVAGPILDVTMQGSTLVKMQDLNAVFVGFGHVDQSMPGDQLIFKEGSTYYSEPAGIGQVLDVTQGHTIGSILDSSIIIGAGHLL